MEKFIQLSGWSEVLWGVGGVEHAGEWGRVESASWWVGPRMWEGSSATLVWDCCQKCEDSSQPLV